MRRTFQRTRFFKLYKYKYKRKIPRPARQQDFKIQNKNFDQLATTCDDKKKLKMFPGTLMLLALLLASHSPQPSEAFCPFKCHCDDSAPSLSANCTQVPSISIVPMTLNPLLKRLILNQLPLSDLSNSLSIYRQLEYLNLNSNKLAQIRYQNFNFKPTPSRAISMGGGGGARHAGGVGNQTAAGGELLARHLKLTLERELLAMSAADSDDDEIRHHLRELLLADNKLEHLGEPTSSSDDDDDDTGTGEPNQRRLRAHELERMAPFLTLSKLERLDLSGNALARLHQHAFLGLLRLTHLNLARNQLEWLDRRALVGLLALEWLDLSGNRLVRQQAQLGHLGRSICRGPLVELRHLNLGDNYFHTTGAGSWNFLNERPNHLVLPDQMFQCAPRLRELGLRNLRLKYLQVNAFDQVRGLERLDLSENLFEQVPLQNLISEDEFNQGRQSVNNNNNQLGASLRELNLTGNLIEFVNANSFRGFEKLAKLELNSMSQLISFDLASLAPEVGQVNSHLRELHASHNKHLLAFHSSLSRPIHFERLQVLNLQGSSGLRELQLERMLTLGGAGGASNSQDSTSLRVDLSQANQLNCSSCHMSWLVDQVRLQTGARGHRPPTEASVEPASSRLAWTPIQFDPNNLFAVPPAPQPPVVDLQAPLSGRLHLLNTNSINCAWPFSMPLVELLNLETTYAPLFNQSCPPSTIEAHPRHYHNLPFDDADPGAGVPSFQQVPIQFDQDVQSSSPSTSANSDQLRHHAPIFGPRANSSGPLDQQGGVTAGSSTPFWTGSIVLLICIALALIKLTQLLIRRHRHLTATANAGGGFKFSPSFTVTTSLGDSPTASSSSSHGSGGGAPGAKRQLYVQQQLYGQRPTLTTSTLPADDAGPGRPQASNDWHSVSAARNNDQSSSSSLGHLARLGLVVREKFQKSFARRRRGDAAPERVGAPSDEITFWPVASNGPQPATPTHRETTQASARVASLCSSARTQATTIGPRTASGKMMLSPVFLSAREFQQLQREHASRARAAAAATAQVISARRGGGGGDEPEQSNLFSRFVGRLSGRPRRRRRPTTTTRDFLSGGGGQWDPPTGNSSELGLAPAPPFGRGTPTLPPRTMMRNDATGQPRVNYQVVLHNQQQQQQQLAIYGNQSAISTGDLNHYSVCENDEQMAQANVQSPGLVGAMPGHSDYGRQLIQEQQQQTFLSTPCAGIYRLA